MEINLRGIPNLVKGKSSSISPRLVIAAGLVALFVAIPLVYIFIRALGADPEDWQRLLQARLWELLVNTIALVVVVTGGTLIIGVGMAWMTERTDLPGRKVFRWMLAMPLAIPTYIGGIVHLALLRSRGGMIPRLLESLAGQPVPTPSPLGFWGAAFILTIFMYPYVYLLSGAAFRSQHASLEEAARTMGRTPWQVFWQVTLPALRPGLMAGALLVSLDVLAEYGTVALLRYETFSSAIFVQLAGRYDRSAASILSGVLVGIAIVFLWAELRLQGQARFTQMESDWRPAPKVALLKWKTPAFLLVLGVTSASLLVPISVLLIWSLQAFFDPQTLSAVLRTGSQGFGNFVWNSLWTSSLAALLAVALSLPVAIYSVRYPNRLSRLVARLPIIPSGCTSVPGRICYSGSSDRSQPGFIGQPCFTNFVCNSFDHCCCLYPPSHATGGSGKRIGAQPAFSHSGRGCTHVRKNFYPDTPTGHPTPDITWVVGGWILSVSDFTQRVAGHAITASGRL